jgi:hypothetical protein
MVTCGVLFEVRTELLNIVKTSFGFKSLTQNIKHKCTCQLRVTSYFNTVVDPTSEQLCELRSILNILYTLVDILLLYV